MTEQQQACMHSSGCALTMNLSWVPGAALFLCVLHKREWMQQHGQGVRSQGALICPQCNKEIEIKGARGSRARSAAQRIAKFAFTRHIDTCATRRAILGQ